MDNLQAAINNLSIALGIMTNQGRDRADKFRRLEYYADRLLALCQDELDPRAQGVEEEHE